MTRLCRGILCLGLLLLALAAQAQENPMPTPFLSSKSSVAMRNDVRAILGISGKQAAEIQYEIDNLGSVPLTGVAGGSLAIFEALDTKVRGLLSVEQWKRLVELWIQFEGPFVVQSPEIRDALKLELEVLQKVDVLTKEFTAWWNKEMPKVRRASDLTKIQNEARKVGRKILALLTADQRKAFDEMQGPKFKFRN